MHIYCVQTPTSEAGHTMLTALAVTYSRQRLTMENQRPKRARTAAATAASKAVRI